jgi:hypothetical protein
MGLPRTDVMEFADVVATFAGRLTIIDNHLMFALSHMLGARAFEVHLCNYWPQWGIRLIDDLAAGRYPEVQRALVREAMRSISYGSRSSRATPAAMAISTSCAWS